MGSGHNLQMEAAMRSVLTALLVAFGIAAVANAQGAREVEIYAEKVGEDVHWMPEKVEGTPGETVLFVLHSPAKLIVKEPKAS
jgi:plastocyanin